MNTRAKKYDDTREYRCSAGPLYNEEKNHG